MAAKETILMDEIKKLKSENSNLKTQLETEQAKVWLCTVLFANTGMAYTHVLYIHSLQASVPILFL